jgi:lysophospholipase L1-like esterase
LAAVTIGVARVASGTRSNSGESIRPGSDRVITVGGSRTFTIEPGALIVSDPVHLPVTALSDVVVSLYVPHNTGPLTVHSLGLHTTNISDGDTTASASFAGTSQNRSYFWLTGIDVLAPSKAAALVAFGDSITDGFATTPDTDRAWPSVLARRLLDNKSTRMVSVANVGISGNRLLHDGAGTNALARFDRDVLARPGVRWVLLLEGINDISFGALPGIPPDERVTRDELIGGYRKFIEKAHVQGLKVIGATILPWEGVWTFNEAAETMRQEINRWILTCGLFDRVIDFDAVMRDPDHPRRLLPQFDSGDHVHPNDAGNEAMARAVDVTFFGK